MSATESNDENRTEQPNEEHWYDDIRVLGFEEKYSNQGNLMYVELTLKAEFFERGEESPIPVAEEKFVMKAKPDGRHKNLRVSRFYPDRQDEARGLHYAEFPLFWEAVGELDARGFQVDTGAFEYGGSPLEDKDGA